MGTLVAVNTQDLYYSARRSGGEMDYKRLWSFIQAKEKESMAVAYVVRTHHHDSSGFENILKGVGYRVSTRVAERVEGEGRSRLRYASHDIRIALDAALKYVDKYEKFVLVTGDEDFSDLFTLLKQKGKETEIWSFHRELSSTVVQGVDRVEHLGPDVLLPGGR